MTGAISVALMFFLMCGSKNIITKSVAHIELIDFVPNDKMEVIIIGGHRSEKSLIFIKKFNNPARSRKENMKAMKDYLHWLDERKFKAILIRFIKTPSGNIIINQDQ